VRELIRHIPRPELLANLAMRSLLVYFGAEAVNTTLTDPSDRRFAGKGIALRNALLVGGFSMLLPVLYRLGPKRRGFPWFADAVWISVPVADMAGNSFDLYNSYGLFDSLTHFYGTAAASTLATLAANGRGVTPAPYRWLIAAGTTTFFHVLLELQEYWTDVFFGTHNVEGLEDTEGDLTSGMVGALAGVALGEALVHARSGSAFRDEAARLGATFETLVARGPVGRLVALQGGKDDGAGDPANGQSGTATEGG
jgi:hypothetical protein